MHPVCPAPGAGSPARLLHGCRGCGGGAPNRRWSVVLESSDVDVYGEDTSAFVLAGEQQLTMHVFDVGEDELMKRICLGEDIGTLITS